MLFGFGKKKIETPAAEPVAAAPEPQPAPAPTQPPAKQGWWSKLQQGLSRTAGQLGQGINQLFNQQPLSPAALQELEELLIMADVGPARSAVLVAALAKHKFEKDIDGASVRRFLAEQISAVLQPLAQPLPLNSAARPHVVLMVGVNGAGKTTTLGKIAQQLQQQGQRVMLAAADTFRAAAVQQLVTWGERAKVPVFAAAEGADPASVAFAAYAEAKAQNVDVLLIDTAGRLHNKDHLMAELQKIVRVLQKHDQSAPHATLLTLDATTGQNAVAQVATFKGMVPLSGLIVTKLDGTARAGVLLPLADQFALPIMAIGVGEGVADLQPFNASAYAQALLGLEST